MWFLRISLRRSGHFYERVERMISGMPGVRELSSVFFIPVVGLGAPLPLVVMPFWDVVGCVFTVVVLEGRAVGCRGASRLYRISEGDELVVLHLLYSFFVGGVKSVVEGILQYRFCPGRWEASFYRYWEAVCRQGPCGPVRCPEPCVNWILLDLHSFYKWALDLLKDLNYFVNQVAVARRDSGLHRWAGRLREDLVVAQVGFCSTLSISCYQR